MQTLNLMKGIYQPEVRLQMVDPIEDAESRISLGIQLTSLRRWLTEILEDLLDKFTDNLRFIQEQVSLKHLQILTDNLKSTKLGHGPHEKS